MNSYKRVSERCVCVLGERGGLYIMASSNRRSSEEKYKFWRINFHVCLEELIRERERVHHSDRLG